MTSLTKKRKKAKRKAKNKPGFPDSDDKMMTVEDAKTKADDIEDAFDPI